MYYSWTPYHYCANNPVILLDPFGMFIVALDKKSQTAIRNSLPKKIREFVVFDKNGKLDAESLAKAVSDDIIFTGILALAKDEENEVRIYSTLEFRCLCDILKPYVLPDENGLTIYDLTDDTAIKGFTFLPTETESGVTEVLLNQNNSELDDAKNSAHELLIHVLRLFQGKSFNHFTTDKDGNQIKNDEVNELVEPIENQAEQNYLGK